MKHFKIAGLCLVAMVAMSMVVSATASAAGLVFEQCTTEKTSTATKYSEHQCVKAESGGGWQWNEVKGTEKVTGHGSLKLSDTKTILGDTTISCSGTEEGVAGPKNLDVVEKVKAEKCEITTKGGCESLPKKVAEPVDLPWQTELFETEGKKFDKLTSDGHGEPGWAVECETALGNKVDTCTSESGKEETTPVENKATGLILLVLSIFRGKSGGRKAKCSEGGKESGEVEGNVAFEATNGWGFRVS